MATFEALILKQLPPEETSEVKVKLAVTSPQEVALAAPLILIDCSVRVWETSSVGEDSVVLSTAASSTWVKLRDGSGSSSGDVAGVILIGSSSLPISPVACSMVVAAL